MAQERTRPRILIVDDDDAHRYMLAAMLADWGWESGEAADGEAAVTMVRAETPFDAVLMDVRMARMDGMTALKEIHRLAPALPVVIMTAYSSVDDAVAAIKSGAHDYLTKPLDFDRLKLTLEQALEHHQVEAARIGVVQPRSDLPPFDPGPIIGRSAPMAALLETLAFVAPTDATVLITGESGTGKELVAEAIHRNSPRRDGPFVAVNCAAMVENLLESELFGHEKGAFTGADRRRDGKFVQAHTGTIFLDEIGETSPAMQAKLLRVLQEHEVCRVGGQEPLKVDVRVLAATNRVLEDEVAKGNFREDLYYRLNVVTVSLPPLRERHGDVPLLAEHFLARFAEKNRRPIRGISRRCLEILEAYPWPGNVRELENAIERGVILQRGDVLDVDGLPLTIQNWAADQEPAPAPTSLEEAERQVIARTMAETNGNRSEAARRLGITRKTLLGKLRKYGLA